MNEGSIDEASASLSGRAKSFSEPSFLVDFVTSLRLAYLVKSASIVVCGVPMIGTIIYLVGIAVADEETVDNLVGDAAEGIVAVFRGFVWVCSLSAVFSGSLSLGSLSFGSPFLFPPGSFSGNVTGSMPVITKVGGIGVTESGFGQRSRNTSPRMNEKDL